MKTQPIWDYITVPFLIILGIGLLFLVLGLLLSDLPAIFTEILKILGISLIAVACTAPISDYFQFVALSKQMELLKGAQTSGLDGIFQSRIDDKLEFAKAVNEEFKAAGEIRMVGIAFPEFFGALGNHMEINNKFCNPNFPIKVLLLNPESDAAKTRESIEQGRQTIKHIELSLLNLKSALIERLENLKVAYKAKKDKDLQEAIMGSKLEIRLYDFDPIAHIIMTDHCLFLEQYHFGKLPNARIGECIGGKMPVMLYSSHCQTYAIIESHFNYIWNNKSKDITAKLLSEPAL